MSLRPLHLLGSPPLRERSSEVATVDEDTRRFIDDLFKTMDAAKGVGLAANQVGVTTRIAVVDADGHRFAMVNPVIVEQEGKDVAEEGCLSIPDLYADVTRSTRVVLEALDRDGCPFRLEAEGLKARVIQHEIDHLDGILFVDRLSPLKRKLLVKRWRKSRKGAGHIQEIAASDTKA
ncbi:MAG: peptide deformylase [Gemmatimonadales bacterium]|nr:peptide deformylase [Gemmatimonadales bacterium]